MVIALIAGLIVAFSYNPQVQLLLEGFEKYVVGFV